MEGGQGSTAAILSKSLPVLPVIIPLAVHFLLVNFVLVYDWLPLAYLFVHLGLVLVGIWVGLDKQSIIPVIAYVVVLLMSGLIDIIVLGLYFEDTDDYTEDNPDVTGKMRRNWQFSAAMCIINLLLKPLTLALACIAIWARIAGSNAGGLFGGRDSYSTLGGSSEPHQPQ